MNAYRVKSTPGTSGRIFGRRAASGFQVVKAVLLAAAFAVGLAGAAVAPAQAASTISVEQFVSNNTGKSLTDPNGNYRGECVSLVKQFHVQVVGGSMFSIGGSAYRMWTNFSSISELQNHYTKVSASSAPLRGDIAVWNSGSYMGSDGHVGIVWSNIDSASLQVFDQSTSKTAAVRTRKKTQLLGYLRPKTPVSSATHKWEGVAVKESMAHVDLGPNKGLWGVSKDGTIYEYTGNGTWAARGEGFADVSVGSVSDSGPFVYATTTGGAVRRWRTDHWEGVAVKESMAHVDLGPNKGLWGVSKDGTIYEYTGNGTWAARGEGFADVSVGSVSDSGPFVYATTTGGAVRRWRTDHWEGVAVKESMAHVDLGPNKGLWGVSKDGTIYEYTGNGTWAARGEGFADVSVGSVSDSGPFVYATTTGGAVRRWR